MTSSNSAADAATEVSKPAEADLLEWLEGFAERLNGRTNAVADAVQQVVEAMDTVELNLQNTFNSFRCLSSSQFVENHVYEEDETDFVTTGMSRKDAKRLSMPTESYEDEILPRYKDAVAFAWAAFQNGGRQHDQRTVQPGSRTKVRDSHHGERIQILPHIIGSEEFSRDVYCGLAELRHWQHEPESDTEVESGRAGLAAESSGTGILFEEDISATQSDAFDYQEEGAEPAVSAALDFKAMLEAALRNPSLPYDGGTSNDALYGEFTDNRFSLPNLTSDNLNNSPRTISTMVDIIGMTMSTMDESKEKLRGSTSQQSSANVNSTQLPPATEPLQILDDPTPSSTVEELLTKPPNSITQAMLNEEFKQYIDGNNGDRQVGTGHLVHLPIIPGGLFNDEARDTGFVTKEDSVVPNSNTGPTIPEGLFEEMMSAEPKRTKSQSSNSSYASQIQPRPQPFLGVVPKSSNQDSETVSIDSESGNLQSASSLTTKHSSSSISSGSNVILGSQVTGQLPLRGGLFDDDEDDEDEDAGDLFGATAPKVDSHPVLRAWASQSSKGLFDDLAKERDRAGQSPDEAGSSQEGQRNSDFASVLPSQYKSQSDHGAQDLLKQPVDNTIDQTDSQGTRVDLGTSSGSKETEFNDQSDVKDNMQLPFQPTAATTIRSSVPLVAASDDESWSGSESGVEEVVQGTTLIDQPIQQDASMHVPSNDESGAKEFQSIIAEGILDLMPESIIPDTEHLSQSPSSTENTTAAIHGEREDAALSSQTAPEASPAQTAPEVSPARFPPAISRSVSSTETSPVKISVKPTENPLLPKAPELSDSEVSDSSDSAHSARSSSDFHGTGQRQILQTTVAGTETLPEKLQPSASQVTGLGDEAPSSSAHNSGNKLGSEDLSEVSSTSLPLPVKELGRPPTRTFIPLFDDDDDDDAEDDLFGKLSPKRRS
ncbi:unnamed protein product [Calypogeia fissa]